MQRLLCKAFTVLLTLLLGVCGRCRAFKRTCRRCEQQFAHLDMLGHEEPSPRVLGLLHA